MPSKFRGKIFNENVFERYLKTLPSTKELSMVLNAVFENVNKYNSKLSEQAGGYFITEPIKGRIGGTPVPLDGVTNIPDGTERDTFFQTKIAFGEAMNWGEDDFPDSLTGTNFMPEASEIKQYWDERKQKYALSFLKGIFSMTGSNGFVDKHTYTATDKLEVGDALKAAQKALGDKNGKFDTIFMHSMVAVNLQINNLINFLKYTDKDGVTRDLKIGTWNGYLVIVDDDMPIEYTNATYSKTTDTTITSGKTYYTRSGSAGSYVYTEVTEPKVADIGNYYEMTSEGTPMYVSYMMQNRFFEFEEVNVKVPVENVRDAKTRGGRSEIINRKRYVIVPKYISYVDNSKIAPKLSDIENGANWEVVNNGDTSNKVYVEDKLIPVVKIVSKG